MMKFKLSLVIVFVLSIRNISFSQTNIDFETGNLNGWTGLLGANQDANLSFTACSTAVNPPLNGTNLGMIPKSYFSMMNTGNDPYGGFSLTSPLGGSDVIRLGNQYTNVNDGSDCITPRDCGNTTAYCATICGTPAPQGYVESPAEAITQTFAVTSANALLTYAWAAVLNDGGHMVGEEPYVEIKIYDQSGAAIPCFTNRTIQKTSVVSPGWAKSATKNCYYSYSPPQDVYYKGWTTVNVLLSSYIGQSVTVRFAVAGCTEGAHFGYAYFDAKTSSVNSITASNPSPCAGQSVQLYAPVGISGAYSWSGPGIVSGANTATVTVNAAGTYTLSVPNTTGTCTATFTASVTYGSGLSVTASAASSTICPTQSVVLTAGGTGITTYTWSANAGGVTTNTASVNPSATTIYTVTGGNGSGCTGTQTVQVIVTPTPTLTISGTTTLCQGQSTVLTAGTSAGTYTWSGNAGGGSASTVTVSPGLGITSYTLSGDNSGCPGTKTVSVTVNPNPTVMITSPATHCTGSTMTLTASTTAGTYTWSANAGGGSGATATVNPGAGTITYTLNGSNGTCTNSTTATVSVTATPTLTVNSPTICSNAGPVTLTVSSANTYTWSVNAGSATTSTVSVNPTSTDVYTVTGDNGNGCTAVKTATVTVANQPTVTISSPATHCTGSAMTLTASTTAGTYTWSANAGGGSGGTTTVNPGAGTITYTLNGSNGTCTNTTTATVTVTATPTLTVNSPTICNGGGPVTLTVSSANTYTWSANAGSATTNTVSVNPTSTDVYTVTGDNGNGCTSTQTATVTISPTPTISLTNNSYTICTGNSATLTSSGATTYTWTTGTGLNCTSCASPVANPTTTTTYTVSGNVGSCLSAPSTVTVNVNSLPSVGASSSADFICSSNSVTLTATGAVTYTWSPAGGLSSATGTTVTATPGAPTDYTVTGTDANGCDNTSIVSINVIPTPTMSISSLPAVSCAGQSVVLTGGTANTYTWSSNAGSANTSTVSVNPSVPTSYTLTGSNGPCTSQAVTTVNVNTLPVIGTPTITGAPCGQATGCIDSVAVSSGTPGYQYSWDHGTTWSAASNHCGVAAGPYTVVVKDVNGCLDSTTVNVSNISGPNAPAVAVSSVSVCVGSNVSLNVNSPQPATIYTWTDASGTHTGTTYTIANINPAGNYTVSITATDSSTGCLSTATQTAVTVNALPNINAVATSTMICSGQSTVLTASGASSYTWSTNAGSVTTNTASVNPTANTTYTVTGDNAGCVSTQTVDVNVTTTPTVTANSSGNICTGQTATLTAMGATNYTWSPGGATTNTITVSPTANATYVVTGDNAGCSDTQTIAVNVGVPPAISATATQTTICTGQSTTLSASGASNYTWTPGGGGNSITVSPAASATYVVTGDNGGCAATQTVAINVNQTPTDPTLSAGNGNYCQGDVISSITANGTGTILWYDNAGLNPVIYTGATYTPSGTVGTNVYYVVDSSAAGCKSVGTVTVSVTVNPTPAAPAVSTSAYAYCQSQTVGAINATGNPTILWSTSPTMNPVINAGSTYTPTGLPVGTTTYYLQDSSAAGCKSAATTSVTVTIYPNPTVSGGQADTAKCGILNGGVSGINVSGGTPNYHYQWYDSTGTILTGDTLQTLNNIGPGSYSVLITDANGCTAIGPVTSTSFTIASIAPVAANITPALSQGTPPLTVTFTASTSGATMFGWNFGDGTFSTAQNPNPVIYNIPGTYTVTLTASNSACMDTATAIVIIDAPVSITIPNIYSPNGDGINDEFYIQCIGIRTLHCDIFNRWGTLVYQLLAVDQKWDGIMNNGNAATDGTYFYILDATGFDGKTYKSHGSLTLVR